MMLTSHFGRAVARILGMLMLLAAFAIVVERWRTGHWWTRDYLWGLAGASALFVSIVCIMFVPRRIELTDDVLVIDYLFDRRITIPLDELERYMHAEVFMVQVRDRGAYQFCGDGFPRAEWRAFVREVETRFPERKAHWYAGARLFGRRNT
jgi:hypothetical protein